jgi:hypothetical protein
MLDTLEQIVNYDKVISCTIACTGASSAMCGVLGSTKHTSGTVCAANAVATIAGVGGSVLIGTHIIKEHLTGNKDLNNLYGLMAVPVLAVGAVRLATSFMDDASTTPTNVNHNYEEDVSDNIDEAIDIIKAVQAVYEVIDGNGCTVDKIVPALEKLAEEVDDCDCLDEAIKDIKCGKTTPEEVSKKAKEATKEEAITAIEDLLDELDDCKTKDIKTLIEEAETMIEKEDWCCVLKKLEEALKLAEKM